MNRIEIERIVRLGAESLADSIYYYWPSSGDNEIPEANITVHLGRAFLNSGFLCFAEAHTRDKVKPHLDLVALSPSDGTVVVSQFKRIFNPERVNSLTKDVAAIRDFRLQDKNWRDERLESGRAFGLVAGTTWMPEYAKWWAQDNCIDPTRDEALKALDAAIGKHDVDWGIRALSSTGSKTKGLEQQWLLYCIFDLQEDVWGK